MGSCLGPQKQNRRKQKIIIISNYHILIQQRIAQGAYGDIWKCKDLKSSSIYAAKEIKLQTSELEQMYNKQIGWLSRLKQSNRVIKFIGAVKIPEKQKAYNNGIILTQFYQLSLFDELKNHIFTLHQILSVTKQILKALKEIHEQNCIHLDIKPENILIDTRSSQFRYKLCDFGSCQTGAIDVKSLNKAEKSKLKQYIQANSTMIYRAPEICDIEGMTKSIDQKVDIWMLGCIMYLMVFRKHPFQNQGPLAIMTGCHNYPQIPSIKIYQQNQFDCIIEMIKMMLCVNQADRANQQTLLKKIEQVQRI